MPLLSPYEMARPPPPPGASLYTAPYTVPLLDFRTYLEVSTPRIRFHAPSLILLIYRRRYHHHHHYPPAVITQGRLSLPGSKRPRFTVAHNRNPSPQCPLIVLLLLRGRDNVAALRRRGSSAAIR